MLWRVEYEIWRDEEVKPNNEVGRSRKRGGGKAESLASDRASGGSTSCDRNRRGGGAKGDGQRPQTSIER